MSSTISIVSISTISKINDHLVFFILVLYGLLLIKYAIGSVILET